MQIFVVDLAYLSVHAIRSEAPNLLVTVVAGFLLLFVGLALPAVWSRKARRRKAALEVLKLVLEFTRLILEFLRSGQSTDNHNQK
jgi:hypothetical protein